MKTFEFNRVKIEDTYSEAFEGLFLRPLITAERGQTPEDTNSPFLEYDPLRFAAYRTTSTPAVVVGRPEAGIEKWLKRNQTPDGREGVVIQHWMMFDGKRSLEDQAKKLNKETSIRDRQDTLSASGGTTRVFDWMPPKNAVYEIGSHEMVGNCGGGYESKIYKYGRRMISVPLMMGFDFEIENRIGCGKGVMGANLWLFCESVETGRKAGRAAIEAIKKVDGVITPFFICPSGSMEKNYPPIGPPTNYPYCPTLKYNITDSKVPEGVKSIPEIVIDGMDSLTVEKAMREGITAASYVDGVKIISAGNYGGKLGQHKIYLRNLFT
jgi:formylmethanofuran--tetrahydromethanopterin N-formyltransferase